MSGPVIETPEGKGFHTKSGTKAKLEWNSDFQPKHQMRYTRAQRFVDSEVLRRSEPYIPLLTGLLIKSGILATDIGSGRVSWIAPIPGRTITQPESPDLKRDPFEARTGLNA